MDRELEQMRGQKFHTFVKLMAIALYWTMRQYVKLKLKRASRFNVF